MNLVVVSHKLCWTYPSSPEFFTNGGFPFQMRALSELFDSTVLVMPAHPAAPEQTGLTPLRGHNISVTPLSWPKGTNLCRKLKMPVWFVQNGPTLIREIMRADAVHVPIPGDVGTLGLLLARMLHKPLFVRYCGNWLIQRTTTERFLKWLMERMTGSHEVLFATGGALEPPSHRNPAIRWIFSTSLTQQELVKCSIRRHPVSAGRMRLITVGRQERLKGTGAIIQSMPLLLQKFPGITLDVVGSGSALAEFKELAQKLGVTERVFFHKNVSHKTVISLLQQADLFCFPTMSSEGFPKAVLEALACGLPVITTPVSVLPQLIGNGCGVLIDEITPEKITQAVCACVVDPNRYMAMSQYAVATARQYSLEQWKKCIGIALQESWGTLQSHG